MKRTVINLFFLLTCLGCEDKLAWVEVPEDTGPVVIRITPTSGAAGTEVEITGTNFSSSLSSNSVTIHETSAKITAASSTKIVFVAPSETTGPVVVTVNNKQASNKPVFTFQ
jgi:uncharacterized protein (TIGR03437 family)